MIRETPLKVVFYITSNGNEPVRDWLKELPRSSKKLIGEDIKTVQFGWPMGMPVVKKIENGIWEIRTKLDHGIARVLFTTFSNDIVLLHGFIKKTQKLPQDELNLARQRLRDFKEDM